MIYSMTAFSRLQSQGEWGSLVCEIRSINHRYLEISINLSEMLRVFEMTIRDAIRQHIKRGKIECLIRYKPHLSEQNTSITINTHLVKELCKTTENIAGMLKNAGQISPLDMLLYPGVVENQEIDIKKLQPMVLQLVNQTLTDLLSARAREGEELNQLFLQRLQLIKDELAKIKERLPYVMQGQRERMYKRFNDVKLELDPARLEQEMLIFSHRIDVAEEIERTEMHVTEMHRILSQHGPAGRRLDFLLQELNREANTLGSKSVDTDLTHAAVEMKVLIEQIREQVQNVE